MKRAQIAELKAHLSKYLAQVRTGDTVIVCDRNTPIARLVPYQEADARFVVHEPTRPAAALRTLRGVKPRRAVDVVALLRDGREQR
jgi:prevent-host-death family protein